jgi:hydroxymethylbilane synthase
MSDSPPSKLVIGTRRSKLARIQADMVADFLRTANPSMTVDIAATDPIGDRDKTSALYEMTAFAQLSQAETRASDAPGETSSVNTAALAKSLWTGELEEMLAKGDVDIVVHCLKDMATQMPEGMVLGAILKREDPRDVVVLPRSLSAKSAAAGSKGQTAHQLLESLPRDALIGTSSLRRTAQLRRKYPHLKFDVVRGNVPTRVAKLDDPKSYGEDAPVFAAIILAAAGLLRLDMGDRISTYLDGTEDGGSVMYAVGQGALAIEAREGDERVLGLLQTLDDRETRLTTTAERSMLRKLEGGCSVPVGVETILKGNKLSMKAVVVSVDGSQAVQVQDTAEVNSLADAEKLGLHLAHLLVERGASRILDEINEERRKTIASQEADLQQATV